MRPFPGHLNNRIPTDFGGLTLWLKADAITGLNDDELVTSWPDSSGNAYHANEGSDASRPTFKTNVLNGLPVVRFGGSHGRQIPSAVEAAFDLATYSLFAVAKKTSGSGSTVISKNVVVANATRRKFQITINTNFGLASGGDGLSISTPATTTNWNIYGVIAKANNNNDLILNGVVNNKTTTLAHDSFNNGKVEIGQAFSNGAERLTGDIAEIILFNSPLAKNKRIRIMDYLAKKWALPVTLEQ